MLLVSKVDDEDDQLAQVLTILNKTPEEERHVYIQNLLERGSVSSRLSRLHHILNDRELYTIAMCINNMAHFRASKTVHIGFSVRNLSSWTPIFGGVSLSALIWWYTN